VWFWDADRQTQQVVENTYPNTVVDQYPFSEAVVSSAELDRVGARTADQPDISLPARASGNPIVPNGSGSGGSSLTVGGPGTVTFRIPQSRHVTADGQFEDNRWTVVMTRSLSVESASDGVSLEAGTRASIAFAIWDGSQRDRDGKKLVTIWNDLELE
jgi:DMSO reductase family type II enzyme heme b subunit